MKIGFFGCSFTEGGGLDSELWYRYAKENDICKVDLCAYPENSYELTTTALRDKNREMVRDRYRFSTLVGNKLNCEVENFAESRNSNENIINQLYENIDKFDVFVVQLTVYTRKYIWWEPENKFYNISGVDFIQSGGALKNLLMKKPLYTKPLIETYKNYITFHHNEDYERKKYCRYIDLFENLGKEIYWIFYDPTPKVEGLGDNVLYWNLRDYVVDNELEMIHQTNGFYKDRHLSMEGNEVVANKIVGKINENR